MNRHEFAPHIVPPDIRRFLAPPEDSSALAEFQTNYKSFYQFYQDYCTGTSDKPIVREVNGTDQNFENIIATKITRSKEGRHAIVLRSTISEYNETNYHLFIKPFDSDELTEFVITQTKYNIKDDDFPSGHFSLFLATALDGRQGVLEIGSDDHHTSIWSFDGNEYILENIPQLKHPDNL